MGFSDRLRSWFKGESKRSTPSKSTESSSRSSTKELEEFVRSRVGVEAYVEPKTAIYSTTLLLVADDGEYLRRPVKSREQAGEFCGRINIPLYDAAKVGYPKRMRDYDQGNRPRKVELSELPPWPGDEPPETPSTDGPPPPPRPKPAAETEPAVQPEAPAEEPAEAAPSEAAPVDPTEAPIEDSAADQDQDQDEERDDEQGEPGPDEQPGRG